MSVRVGARCQPSDGLEEPVKMRGAQPCPVRHFFEAWDFRRGLDVHRFPRLSRRAARTSRLTRHASLARTEARAFGLLWSFVKADVFRLGQACSAGRPAVHAGRPHRVIDLAIEGAIAGDDGLPSCVLTCGNSGDFRFVEHTALLRRGFDLEVYLTRCMSLRTPALAFKLGQESQNIFPAQPSQLFRSHAGNCL